MREMPPGKPHVRTPAIAGETPQLKLLFQIAREIDGAVDERLLLSSCIDAFNTARRAPGAPVTEIPGIPFPVGITRDGFLDLEVIRKSLGRQDVDRALGSLDAQKSNSPLAPVNGSPPDLGFKPLISNSDTAQRLKALEHVANGTAEQELGIQLTRVDDRREVFEAVMPVWEATCDPSGHVSGGAIAHFVEGLTSYAAVLRAEEKQGVVGLNYNMSYSLPALGNKLIARAEVLAPQGRKTSYLVTVWDENGWPVCTSGPTTMAITPAKDEFAVGSLPGRDRLPPSEATPGPIFFGVPGWNESIRGCLPEVIQRCESSQLGFLGATIDTWTPHEVKAKMPIWERTRQPFGVLAGGASFALASNLAWLGTWVQAFEWDNDPSFSSLDIRELSCTGSHTQPGTGEYVIATARGGTPNNGVHTWTVEIHNELKKPISSITCQVLARHAGG